MYSDVGKKIKTLATACAWVGVVTSLILGVSLISGLGLLAGVIAFALGCFCSWLGYLMLYAFGEITDCIRDIRNKLCDGEEQKGVAEPVQNAAPVETQKAEENSAENAAPDEVWTCCECGTKNLREMQYCSNCKVSRDWSDAHSKN